MRLCFWFSSLEFDPPPRVPLCRKERGRPISLPRLLAFHAPCSGPQRRTRSCKPRCLLLGRRQVRHVRVYRVPLLRADAGGFPGVRPGLRAPRPRLTGVFEAGIPLDTTRLVARVYPLRVRGCVRLRVRLPYPYVPHLLPPFLVTFTLPLIGSRNLSLLSQ